MSKNKEFMENNNLSQTWGQCQNEGGERVEIVPLKDLRDYPEHPFKVTDDEAMAELTDSVRTYGVAVPAIVRPHPDGGFELVSGHRRKRACELAGLTHVPVIIRDLDDNAAAIVMADSNLQRDKLLPSERAYAYEMKLNAMKRQGFRSDLNSSQFGTKFRADELLAQQMGQSRNQIQRYVRLTELIDPLLQMVDEGKIGLNPAYELSFLKTREQLALVDVIKQEQATPSLSQAQRLKRLSQEGALSADKIFSILMEKKKGSRDSILLPADVLKPYFPDGYTPHQMQQTIIRLLDAWKKNRQRSNER